MAYLKGLRHTFFVTLAALLGVGQLVSAAEFDFNDFVKKQPGYSASLSVEFCKASFPYRKIIKRPVVVDGSNQSFDLFAYTARPFDPRKPSIVTVDGGPGGIGNFKESLEMARAFNPFNVVFFHYRGAGCSDFRNPSAAWEALLNSEGVIEDIEAIRAAYGIKNWRGIFGASYGTNIARRYAHAFPDRSGIVILEGLDDAYTEKPLTDEQEVERLISVVRNRIQSSKVLGEQSRTVDIQGFLTSLRNFFGGVPPSQILGHAAAWDVFKNLYEKAFAQHGLSVPKYYSLPTFVALVVLAYAGESEKADMPILELLDQIGYVRLDPAMREKVTFEMSKFDRKMFPFKNSNNEEILAEGSLLNWRVFLHMPAHDEKLPQDSLCSATPMIILNGSQDMATPIENVQRFIRNQSCVRGPVASLTVGGGGHSSVPKIKCLNRYLTQSLITSTVSAAAPSDCPVPITVEFRGARQAGH